MTALNYSTIKQLAKDRGISVIDLCALSPANDPFYTGRDSELTAAEWFTDLWRRFGYGAGVHLRRMHYQVISQDPPVLRPDSKPYENTLNDWAYLNNAGKWARYLNLVSPNDFVDRRNPEAIIHANWINEGHYDYSNPAPAYQVVEEFERGFYSLPELPELGSLPGDLPDLPDFEVYGYHDAGDIWSKYLQQSYHVEVWAEKTTMNDVLVPLCKKYRMNLITGMGEMSITAVVDFLKRVRRAGRPARILYISDYDPAGLGMPISVARKVEFFLRNEPENYDGLDIKLQPLVLTAEQVGQYSLPRVPVKDSDRRKANFEAIHGEGQVELDALEALYPGQLARIVTAAILQYYDPTLDKRAREAKSNLTEALAEQRQDVLDLYEDELAALRAEYDDLLGEFETTREEFNDLVRDFRPKIEAHQGRLEAVLDRAKTLYSKLSSDLAGVDIDLEADDYKLPEPELPEETNGQLYDSRRDFFEQLAHYKAHRNGADN